MSEVRAVYHPNSNFPGLYFDIMAYLLFKSLIKYVGNLAETKLRRRDVGILRWASIQMY